MKLAGVAVLMGLATTFAMAQEPVEELVARLRSADSATRQQAYRQLLLRTDAKVAQLIGAQLATMPAHVRQLALNVLSAQPFAVTRKTYRGLIKAEQPFLRAVGAAMLATWRPRDESGRGKLYRDESAVPVLAAALAAVPERERTRVLPLVRRLKDPAVLEQVRGYLRPDANAGVVAAVFRQLPQTERRRSPAARRAATALLEARDPQVRAAALAFLLPDDSSHAEAFVEVLRERPDAFWLVRDLLGKDYELSTAMAAAIATALEKPTSKFVITRTVELLREKAPRTVIAPLRRLCEHENADYRKAALTALSGLPGGLERKDLLVLLASEDVAARIAAADALRMRDDLSGLAVVRELLPRAGDDKADAARVLSGFRDRSVVPMLFDLLDDQNVAVRRAAWTGLQPLLRGLFPYRRFDFRNSSYRPEQASRAAGLAELRVWWVSVQ